MVRHYTEPCPVCGSALPKGPSKVKRHFDKHPEIFALRAKQTKNVDRKSMWTQATIEAALTITSQARAKHDNRNGISEVTA